MLPATPVAAGRRGRTFPETQWGLYHQNNCCLWKGQADDPGYPFAGVRTSVLPTQSRKALYLCPIKGLRFLFYAQALDLTKFEASSALMGDHNIPLRWWHSLRMRKRICSPIAAQHLLRSILEQMIIICVFAVDIQKFMLHDWHQREERVEVRWLLPASGDWIKIKPVNL